MQHIIGLAERLGRAIAESPQAVKLRDARKAADAEPDLAKTLKDFREHSEKLARLDAQQKPIEVGDKHKLQELHGKLAGSETFKKLTAAQVDYVDLLRKVNEAMQRSLAAAEK